MAADTEHQNLQNLGKTFLVEGNSWAQQLQNEEPLVNVHAEGAQHYLVFTSDEVIDVVTASEPEITEL